jgi:uncharacterized repeat protein (TIGR03803 family)
MKTKSSFIAASWPVTRFLAVLLLALTPLAHGGTETVLHNFGSGSDGKYPSSALIVDSAGNLYGTTSAGGSAGFGTVFKLTPNGGGFTESLVYSFRGSANEDGAFPQGALTADAAGNFYGVTSYGGHYDCGTVFELTAGGGGSWTESVLYSFCADGKESDGDFPSGKLIFDSSGNLYGVTQAGGAHGGGAVFQLTPASGKWTQTVLYSFDRAGRSSGTQPVGIIFDSAGNIDGVTLFGGDKFYNGPGIVFQLVQNPPGRWTQKIIHRFSISGKTAQTPTGGLALDAAGNLYMTMGRGGRGGAGVVELSPKSGGGFTARDLYSFDGPQLLQSYEDLVFDSAGNLYSASQYGGANGGGGTGFGFIYKLSPGSSRWTGTKLATFHGWDGVYPIGGVILDSKGNLYGATYYRDPGFKGAGVVFQVTP